MRKLGCGMITSWLLFALTVTVISQASFGADRLRVGFVDPALPKALAPHNSAALEFARSAAEVTRLEPAAEGCWRDADHRLRASEEFDVVWFHQGDDPAAAHLGKAGAADLLAWLEGGGTLLLSGAAGRLLNELGVEPTPLRVLGVNEVPFVSGLRVLDQHRGHPAFPGWTRRSRCY